MISDLASVPSFPFIPSSLRSSGPKERLFGDLWPRVKFCFLKSFFFALLPTVLLLTLLIRYARLDSVLRPCSGVEERGILSPRLRRREWNPLRSNGGRIENAKTERGQQSVWLRPQKSNARFRSPDLPRLKSTLLSRLRQAASPFVPIYPLIPFPEKV